MKLLILLLLLPAASLAWSFEPPAPPDLTWSRGPAPPLPVGGYQAAWFQDALWIMGGTYWEKDRRIWTDRVSQFDPLNSRWTEGLPLPLPLAYGASAVLDDTLYLLGGSDGNQVRRDIYRFRGEIWETAGQIPEAVVYAAALAGHDRIYLLGGTASLDDLSRLTPAAWSWNPGRDQWERLPDMPGPARALHAAALLGTSLYLFGGYTQTPGGPLTNLDDAFRFDLTERRWSELSRTPLPVRAWSAVPAREEIFLFGGYADRFLDSVYQFSPAAGRYRPLSPMPVPLADIKFVLGRGVFYGAAGEDRGRSRFPGLLIGGPR